MTGCQPADMCSLKVAAGEVVADVYLRDEWNSGWQLDLEPLQLWEDRG